MSVTVPVDAKGALLAYLKANLPDLAADQTPALTIPAASIRGNLQGVTGGGYAVAVVKAGGTRRYRDIPIGEPRMDIHVYGPTAYEAMRLWRLIDALLDPPSGVSGFTAASTRVFDVAVEAEPIELVEEGWDKLVIPVLVRHIRVPVS